MKGLRMRTLIRALSQLSNSTSHCVALDKLHKLTVLPLLHHLNGSNITCIVFLHGINYVLVFDHYLFCMVIVNLPLLCKINCCDRSSILSRKRLKF